MPACTVSGCEEPIHIKKLGYCKPHYFRWYRFGNPGEPINPTKVCTICGNTFESRQPNATRCSKDCKAQADRERAKGHYQPVPPTNSTCVHCGGTYESRMASRMYCSPTCSRKAQGQLPGKACGIDGCERKHIARGMCKMHYRRWAREQGLETPPSNQWGDRRRDNYHRRRARMHGARDGDRALLSDIINRDGDMCGWCDQPVDLNVKWPSPLSKSIDHITPVSRGGEHTLANTRLLHLGCNASKGDSAELTATARQGHTPKPSVRR